MEGSQEGGKARVKCPVSGSHSKRKEGDRLTTADMITSVLSNKGGSFPPPPPVGSTCVSVPITLTSMTMSESTGPVVLSGILKKFTT